MSLWLGSEMNANILVVEDDIMTRMLLHRAFEKSGLVVTTASSAAEARSLFGRRSFDLVVLDVLLPDGSGFDLCREFRAVSRAPILMLTAKDQTDDVVEGLSLGADDYLKKPFEIPELIARIRARLRRHDSPDSQGKISAGRITIDRDARDVWVDGSRVELTPKEFDLLLFLGERLDRPVSKDNILSGLWPDSEPSEKILAVYVRRLRKKIERDPQQPAHLVTFDRFGYGLRRVD